MNIFKKNETKKPVVASSGMQVLSPSDIAHVSGAGDTPVFKCITSINGSLTCVRVK